MRSLYQNLFGTPCGSQLSDESKKNMHSNLESKDTWVIKQNKKQATIHPTEWTQKVISHAVTENLIFHECEKMKKDQSLMREINTPYATNEKIKYIPKVLMSGDKFQAFLMRFAGFWILQKLFNQMRISGVRLGCTQILAYSKIGKWYQRF